MQQVLFQSEVVDREFGSNLLHVPTLLDWAKSNGFHLKTAPPIEGFEFAQVEALLVAIQRPFQSLSYDQAEEIVENHPELRNDPDRRGWHPSGLLGIDAHSKWRAIFKKATEAGELVLLDFTSKLPIVSKESQAVPAKETTAERGARRLALFEQEEKRDKVGALQRVATLEKVDRSNLGKELKKAREARGERKRHGGDWAGQLVRDGKRTP